MCCEKRVNHGFWSVLEKILVGFLALWVAFAPLKGDENFDEKISPSLYEGIQADLFNQNYKKAYEIYEQANKKGDVLGTALLGRLYAYGLGVEANPNKAKVYFHIVLNNPAVKKEVSKAHTYNSLDGSNPGEGLLGEREPYIPTYLSAAMIVVNLSLAHMYEEGLEGKKDPKKAFKLYKLILANVGANNGHGWSLTNMLPYVGGLARLSVSKTFNLKKLPVALLRRLPFIKILVGQTLYKMGMAYKMGVGTGRSHKKAKECFNMAFDLGNKEALKAMRDL
ncbi:tetratricopeptide repeat protein [Helicobacter ailurogastricus]|uniref:tetratricopeptide repeat protein n=1 Tax=Helicobacter ailurogastricus TaxID=1578720 RepID=UPI000CF0C87A|nr:tetratricopeptide repeat protein [Helicobacter ailurogastricus]